MSELRSIPTHSFASATEALRWIASVDEGPLKGPSEVRLFEALNLTAEKAIRKPVSLLRVRVSGSEGRQVFEKCEIACEDFNRDRERAAASECHSIGRPEGYSPDQVAAFVAQSEGQALGPDWQAVKVNLAALGAAATGTVAFFILDPTKLLASATAGIAALNGANAIVEARRSNVLNASTGTLLRWHAATPDLSIVTVNGSLYDSERILRIALRRIDEGRAPLKLESNRAVTEAFEVVPVFGPLFGP